MGNCKLRVMKKPGTQPARHRFAFPVMIKEQTVESMMDQQPTLRQEKPPLAADSVTRNEKSYGNESAPLWGYAGLIVLFTVVAGGFLLSKKRSLPDRIGLSDIFLLGLATQKVSRVVTKSRVTSVMRAPFTKYEGSAGSGEVEERPRGRGVRRAIGELISCPFCMGTWMAFAGMAGFVSRPRLTRALASIFAVSSVSDFAQQIYCRIKEAEDQSEGD
jgi:Protein of unknown function (DUF1360)